jgi:hypothetical protein
MNPLYRSLSSARTAALITMLTLGMATRAALAGSFQGVGSMARPRILPSLTLLTE